MSNIGRHAPVAGVQAPGHDVPDHAQGPGERPHPQNPVELAGKTRHAPRKSKKDSFTAEEVRELFRYLPHDKTGVRPLTPHSCRHTFVSRLQAQGVPMETIQSLAGHAEMDMTEHYLHVQDNVKATAVERLAGLICS